MEKREVVKRALNFRDIPYVPWHFKFTVEAKDKLKEYLDGRDMEEYLQNHLLELGNDIGFFEYMGITSIKMFSVWYGTGALTRTSGM